MHLKSEESDFEKAIYHYNVSKLSKRTSDGPQLLALHLADCDLHAQFETPGDERVPPPVRRLLFGELQKDGVFGNARPCFDGRFSIYSAVEFPLPGSQPVRSIFLET